MTATLNPTERKQRLLLIEERYGEDFADAVDDILNLYSNPNQKEEPEVGTDEWIKLVNDRVEGGWNVRTFFQTFGQLDQPILLQELVDGMRKNEWGSICGSMDETGWCCACHSDPTTANGHCPEDCNLNPKEEHPCE